MRPALQTINRGSLKVSFESCSLFSIIFEEVHFTSYMHSVLRKEVEVFEKETLAQHLSIVLKMLLPGKKGFTKLSYYYELHLYANSSVCYNVTVQYKIQCISIGRLERRAR